LRRIPWALVRLSVQCHGLVFPDLLQLLMEVG
jgi:hypothetical protein